MLASLVFTLIYGTLAAKSRRAEKILIPALDILQYVPVRGYVSFTVAFLFRPLVAWSDKFQMGTTRAW